MKCPRPLTIGHPDHWTTALELLVRASGTDARRVPAAEREKVGNSGALNSPPGLPRAQTLSRLADSCGNPIAINVCLASGTKYSLT